MVCPAVNDQASFQEVIALPRLVTVTFAPKPPCHWLLIVYETWQPAAAWAEPTAVTLRPTAAIVIVAAAAASAAIWGRRLRLILPLFIDLLPVSFGSASHRSRGRASGTGITTRETVVTANIRRVSMGFDRKVVNPCA